MRKRLLFALIALSTCSFAVDKSSLVEVARLAIERSQLTAQGSQPFHLGAHVVEATNRDNDSYNAEIEVYWVAPDKWRRTVKTESFSEIIIMNRGETTAEVAGDYEPNWLRTLVKAIIEPGEILKGVDFSAPGDTPEYDCRSNPCAPKPCRRFAYRVGVEPVYNRVFASYCFDQGRIESVGTPGYRAEYKAYKKFGEKPVARKVREWIEPGTELEASVDLLAQLENPDPTLFESKFGQKPIQTITVNEQTLRSLLPDLPPIQWPPITGGKPKGVLSLYVCLDREGKVRETYALNSDNPFMSDAAAKAVKNWQFKPATAKGERVQIEGILTFAYETAIKN